MCIWQDGKLQKGKTEENQLISIYFMVGVANWSSYLLKFYLSLCVSRICTGSCGTEEGMRSPEAGVAGSCELLDSEW